MSLGFDASYINKIEKNTQSPSFNLLITVCEYFKITPAEFFGGDDEPEHMRQLLAAARKMPPEKLKSLLALLDE